MGDYPNASQTKGRVTTFIQVKARPFESLG